MNDVDVLVVGAGALGLACAARLAEAGHGILVAERERLVGGHTSSRKFRSDPRRPLLPARLARGRSLPARGRERLYAWCARHGVGHRRIGKLLVAVEEKRARELQALAANARACGVDDLMPLDGTTLRALEPRVRGVAALLSPSTGIIDSHAYLQSLQAVAERHGAQLALDTRVDRLERHAGGWRAEGQSVGEAFRLRAGWVVNAGGLFAQRWRNAPKPRSAPGAGAAPVPGALFLLQRPLAVPPPGLPDARGAHRRARHPRHLDLGGQLRFGPDVNYVDNLDYRVDESLRPAFAQAISRYFPGIDHRRLAAGYAGIRPKLGGPGEPAADFIIQTPAEHGLPGLVNLFGIESPGLTASLALAEQVARAL
ncbi:NAD(P)/FAD-dependent oxidoreductase [Pseudomonas aeruginosa]|nr:NAD(P)/FAD-dependent oxidoreductase [Pseudomonas aeruginosa]